MQSPTGRIPSKLSRGLMLERPKPAREEVRFGKALYLAESKGQGCLRTIGSVKEGKLLLDTLLRYLPKSHFRRRRPHIYERQDGP